MGAVFTIAKRDMRSYISAPKGAAIFWFFLLFMGFFFFSFVYTLISMQQQPYGGESPGLDQLIRALFQNQQFILLLIIPAVTMSTFAEERRNHSYRLLQSAPVSSLQVVLAKFTAVCGVMALMLLCSAVYPLFTIAYGTPDVGPILTSYLGVFLLMCSQLAFGLWISSMTSNQLLAFLFTMFGLFMLLILNWMAPNISTGGVSEATIKYIAATTHLEPFLKGMVNVADVAYFLCFTALFLFFTNIALDSQRWR